MSRPFLIFALLLAGPLDLPADDQSAAERVLVVVNGEPITEGDLQFMYLSRGVPPAARADYRETLIEQLIDRRLMRGYLDRAGAKADPDQLELQVARIHQVIRRVGDDPAEVLAKLGFNDARLRSELALPLRWKSHARVLITDERIREYFAQRRDEFDGTEVRARQILLKLPDPPTESALQERIGRLRQLAKRIAAGELSFAEAAKMHSEAPSSREGGDLGWFPFRGRMPRAITGVAFALDSGEISEPFVTQFGVHLLTVIERKPGALSLEDARPEVLEQLARRAWNEIVQREREQAKIERPGTGNSPSGSGGPRP